MIPPILRPTFWAAHIAPAMLLLPAMLGAAESPAPSVSITQAGVQFICTADGQPDMYSWRIPLLDNTEPSATAVYKIPEIEDANLDAQSIGNMPIVSGGRTALKVTETNDGFPGISHSIPPGYDPSYAFISNAEAVHWRDASGGHAPGAIKDRFYSNYPPLSNPQQAGLYGTIAINSAPGSANYARYFSRHPGYDPKNWNRTLATDTPLGINQKRIQAVIHLELVHPVISELEENTELVLEIDAASIANIEINGIACFQNTARYFIIPKSKLKLPGSDDTLGGVYSADWLYLDKKLPRFGALQPDAGFIDRTVTPWPEPGTPEASLPKNFELCSEYFTVNSDQPLQLQSTGPLRINVYRLQDFLQANGTLSSPQQRVEVTLPQTAVPTPDLVTVGTHAVSYVQPGGPGGQASLYNHPALQAPHWWGFNADGVIGREGTGDLPPAPTAQRGRLFQQTMGVPATRLSAVDPRLSANTYRQEVPGARAVLYHYDPVKFPQVGQIPVAELQADRLKRIAYDPATQFNRPYHFGSDTLRTLACINQEEPVYNVASEQFIPPPGYSESTMRIAAGRGFDLPVIEVQPQPQQVAFDGQADFSVTSSGTTAATYQWYHNNQPLQGATARTLTLNSVTQTSRGNYHVVVTNAKGSTPSEPALLKVEDISIQTPPANVTVAAGGNAIFSVEAQGTNLKYQWRRNGINLPKATGTSLTLSKVKPDQAGQYDVVLTSDKDTLISPAASLTVNVPLAILQQPVGGALMSGSSLPLQVRAVGTHPLTYQWQFEGANLDGANQDRLLLLGGIAEPGSYKVIVTDASGSVTSQVAQVAMAGTVPLIIEQPLGQSVEAGAQVHFKVVVEDSGVQYQWRKNGANIARATSGSLVLTNVKKQDEGVYDCVVKNTHGATLSAPAALQVGLSLAFTLVPTDVTVAAGGQAEFQSLVEGEGVAYQWSLHGKAIPGAVYPVLNLPRVDAAQAGIYTVTASRGGEKTSTTAVLTVVSPGSLVYKITATGQTVAGATAQKVALTGYLIVQRSQGSTTPQASLILISKNGSQKLFQEETLPRFRADSTGPGSKTQSVFSSLQGGEDDLSRNLFWLQGAESLVALDSRYQDYLARTLSGTANRLELMPDAGGRPRTIVENLAVKAVLDIPATLQAKQKEETKEQTVERLLLELLKTGHIQVPAGEG